jgi:hypothetical protein
VYPQIKIYNLNPFFLVFMALPKYFFQGLLRLSHSASNTGVWAVTIKPCVSNRPLKMGKNGVVVFPNKSKLNVIESGKDFL